MRAITFTTLGVGMLTVAALSGACGGDDDGTGGSGAGTSSGGNACDPASQPDCPAASIDSDCVALSDNSGADQFALRLSQLSVTAPEVLTGPLVAGIVSDGVTLNLPSCNIKGGKGTFNMLTIFDKTADTLTLAGAFPEQNPENGYCIVNDPANEVEPITVAANLMPDGSFSTDAIARIVVPIFLDLSGDLSSAVFLPLREGRITSGQLSDDQNCVGRFAVESLSPQFECVADPDYFETGASLEGYITLEDADAVVVDQLNQSLCVLLSGDVGAFGDGGAPIERCARDMAGDIVLTGDWCSTTNSAGGCEDAFRLEATVASSAVTVRDDCP